MKKIPVYQLSDDVKVTIERSWADLKPPKGESPDNRIYWVISDVWDGDKHHVLQEDIIHILEDRGFTITPPEASDD